MNQGTKAFSRCECQFLGKEVLTRGSNKYLAEVLSVSGGMATRIIGLIDLAGGWDKFAGRLSEYASSTNETTSKESE